jgi:hypothetical protein
MRWNYKVFLSVSPTKGRLRLVGLFGRRPAKKPKISRKNQKTQLKFSRKHRNRVINLSATCLVAMEFGMCDALTAKGWMYGTFFQLWNIVVVITRFGDASHVTRWVLYTEKKATWTGSYSETSCYLLQSKTCLAGGYIRRTMTQNTHHTMLRIDAQTKEFGLWTGCLQIQT